MSFVRRLSVPLVVAILLVLSATALLAHDLFLTLDSFFIRPGASVRLIVLNGTFTTSENSVSPDRIADLSIVTGGAVTHPPIAAWTETGTTSEFAITTGAPGTYVVGAAIRPRELTLDGAAFNAYLAEEGITTVLAARRRSGAMAKRARERYSKHVKAILQVGDARTPDALTPLGHAAEIVPLDHPYQRRVGDVMHVRCLVDGKPAAGLSVIAGGRRGEARIPAATVTTDAQGVAAIRLLSAGRWYVKFVHMVPVTGGDVDYESKWATLTFEIRASAK